MKNVSVALLMFLGMNSAFAAAPRAVCELNYSYREYGSEEEAVRESEKVTVSLGEEAKLAVRGVTLTAKIEQICAADRPKCLDAYSLVTSMTRGYVKTSTKTSTDLPAQYLTLEVGNESASSLCYMVD